MTKMHWYIHKIPRTGRGLNNKSLGPKTRTKHWHTEYRALRTHPHGALYYCSAPVLYKPSTPVPHKKHAKTKTARCGMKQTHRCAYKIPHTRTGLNKKKHYGQKTTFFTFLIAPELSSTIAIYPFLSRPNISAPIAPIARTITMYCPPISSLHFAKWWEFFFLQIL